MLRIMAVVLNMEFDTVFEKASIALCVNCSFSCFMAQTGHWRWCQNHLARVAKVGTGRTRLVQSVAGASTMRSCPSTSSTSSAFREQPLAPRHYRGLAKTHLQHVLTAAAIH